MSKKAVKKISDEIRKWHLHRRTAETIEDLAKIVNPKPRGWFNYYGRFNPSALRPIERLVGQSLVRWLVGNTRNWAVTGHQRGHG